MSSSGACPLPLLYGVRQDWPGKVANSNTMVEPPSLWPHGLWPLAPQLIRSNRSAANQPDRPSADHQVDHQSLAGGCGFIKRVPRQGLRREPWAKPSALKPCVGQTSAQLDRATSRAARRPGPYLKRASLVAIAAQRTMSAWNEVSSSSSWLSTAGLNGGGSDGVSATAKAAAPKAAAPDALTGSVTASAAA